MAKITDPDNLKLVVDIANIGDQGTSDGNVHVNTSYKQITIAAGWDGIGEDGLDDNLTSDGGTIQCLYSFLKEEWKGNADLIKFPFPMVAITPEQFEFVEGWQPAGISTVNLFRDGGFAVKNTDGSSSSEFAGIITLGDIGSSDQVYYQQEEGQPSKDIALQGVVNQCVKTYGDVTTGAGDIIIKDEATSSATIVVSTKTIAGLTDSSLFTVGGKVYITESDDNDDVDGYTVATIADGTSITIVEAFPGTDDASCTATQPQTITSSSMITMFAAGDRIVITGTDAGTNDGTYTIDTIGNDYMSMTVVEAVPNSPHTETGAVSITADARGIFKIFVREQAKLYAQSQLGDIGVSSLNYQAYRFPLANAADLKITHTDLEIDANADGTPDVAPYTDMTITYHAVDVQRAIGSGIYDFDVIIDAGTAGNATAEEIYEFVQWSLRLNSDIDADGVNEVTGKTADSLLKFVGDTLVTSQGVYIDDFSDTDINRIEFYDVTNTKRVFPYLAAGTISFNPNLAGDTDAVYRMFYTNDDIGANSGYDFGTINAVLVENKDSIDISGDVPNHATDSTEVSFSYAYDSNIQRGVILTFSGDDESGHFTPGNTVTGDTTSAVGTVESVNYSTDTVVVVRPDTVTGNFAVGETVTGDTQTTSTIDVIVSPAGEPAPVTVVAIGLDGGQYVKTSGSILRTNTNGFSLVAALERNYLNA